MPFQMTTKLKTWLIGLAAFGLTGCGGSGSSGELLGFFSTGQVAPQIGNATVGFYAASRFAEQVSLGATPALVEEIRQKGYEKWIDDQFKLPVSQIDPTPFLGYVDPVPSALNTLYQKTYPNFALNAPDQLRTRLAWSLSQFIVVSERKTNFEGLLFWGNLLQKYGDGNYADLLYQVSVSPAMGHYLDNQQNRPKSAECSYCAPNENYARELMQLFTLGVIKLNQDGTYVKNAKGAVVETYTQKEVEELARVMTGWNFDPEPRVRGDRNWGNWGKPMVPSTWPPERDSGQKIIFGQVFPAGQTQVQDLRAAISMLMAHQNIAPFVSTRLIQHFVKSNPTPSYVSRVADKFKNNGAGVAGDMKAVVKAILLDPEARAGDSPLTIRKDDGKLREPFLHVTSVWRGLGCKTFPEWDGGYIRTPDLQRPFSAESVFSFYAPTDRAPGSGLLSPEQKLINASELTMRFDLSSMTRQGESVRLLATAGCDINALINAYSTSPSAFNDFLSARFFRGAMPPTLRSNIEQLIRNPQWNAANISEGALRMLDYALASPYYGVIK
jgi:uncharacterized protein (DUF1800 family)